jgi:hypothetical protein
MLLRYENLISDLLKSECYSLNSCTIWTPIKLYIVFEVIVSSFSYVVEICVLIICRVVLQHQVILFFVFYIKCLCYCSCNFCGSLQDSI